MRRSRVSLLNRSKILSPSNFTGAPSQTVNVNVVGINDSDKKNALKKYDRHSPELHSSVAGNNVSIHSPENVIEKSINVIENNENDMNDSEAGINANVAENDVANVDENNENNEKIVTEINVNKFLILHTMKLLF